MALKGSSRFNTRAIERSLARRAGRPDWMRGCFFSAFLIRRWHVTCLIRRVGRALLGPSPISTEHWVRYTFLGDLAYRARPNDGEASSGAASLPCWGHWADTRSPSHTPRQQSTCSSGQSIPVPHDPSMAQSQKLTKTHISIRTFRASPSRPHHCKPHSGRVLNRSANSTSCW